MKWTGVEVARDAKRYAAAQLNYGPGSRIQRRNLDIELRPKLRDPAYKEAFERELKSIDDNDIYKRIKARKTAENVLKNGRKAYHTANKLYRLWQQIKPYIMGVFE